MTVVSTGQKLRVTCNLQPLKWNNGSSSNEPPSTKIQDGAPLRALRIDMMWARMGDKSYGTLSCATWFRPWDGGLGTEGTRWAALGGQMPRRFL